MFDKARELYSKIIKDKNPIYMTNDSLMALTFDETKYRIGIKSVELRNDVEWNSSRGILNPVLSTNYILDLDCIFQF